MITIRKKGIMKSSKIITYMTQKPSPFQFGSPAVGVTDSSSSNRILEGSFFITLTHNRQGLMHSIMLYFRTVWF